MVKKSLSLIYRIAKWLVIVSVLLMLVVALIIQFYVFPHIDEYKNKIADFASTVAKQKVEIGNIKADWIGFNPHLSVSNINIFDAENRPALQLNNTDVSFSWLSVLKLEPHLADLTIRAPELTIRRNAQGDIFIAGINAKGQSKPDAPNWLLRQSQFKIEHAKVVWLDEMRNAPPLSLNDLNLQVKSPPWASIIKNHRIHFSAQPSVGTAQPISISANIYGNDVSKLAQWRGTVEAKLKEADLTAFKPWVDYPALTHPMDLLEGHGSAEVSLQFGDHQLQSLNSQVSLNHIKVQLRTHAEPVQLSTLAGQFNWISTTNTRKLNVENLSLTASNGLKLDNLTGGFSETNSGNRTLNFKLNKIDLALIQPYLLQLPIEAEPLKKLTALAPVGKLNQLIFNWSGNQTHTDTYKISSSFNGLGLTAYEKIPGFSNLTGSITANENEGKITLDAHKATIDVKHILRWPIPADQLAGDITWQNTSHNNISTHQIETSNLSITSPHLAGTINANYLIDGNKGGLLDLKANFSRADAKFAPFYYPTTLNENTVHWLDTSILSGQGNDVQLIVKGRLADFPFVNSQHQVDPKLGLFRVTAKISKGHLKFAQNWPSIEGLGLNLLFEGTRMALNANTGQILGNQITQCKTVIAQLDADFPVLEINGEVSGAAEHAIAFVNKSPVAAVTQGFTDDLKTSGQGKLTLGLKIPLHDVDATQINGLYQISNGTMQAESIPTLTNINGVLNFTENSLSAKNINASAFGSAVIVDLNTNHDKSVQVVAKGTMNDAGIKQVIGFATDMPLLLNAANYFKGSTDWVGNILIQKPNININIQSNLLGISSSLPAPFNKAANEKLNLSIDKKQTNNSDTLAVTVGNKLAINLLSTGEKSALHIERGSIQFNNSANSINSAELGNAKGIQVAGNLDYLDGDAWLAVLRAATHDSKTDNASLTASLPLNKVAININALDIVDKRINELKISHNTNKEGLRATVQSKELSGDLQWLSQGNGKLIARLDHLIVPDNSPRTKPAKLDSTSGDAKALDTSYPALDITANSFTVNKKNFGALELIASPQGNNWNIEKLKLGMPDSTITASGQWNNWVKQGNNQANTFLNINWAIKNLGKTMQTIGYPDTIKGGEGSISAQLQWPGSPHQFNPKLLNGDLQLDLKNGQVLKVQPGVGRLLGLLSLQSLPRRLTLDFRDLFSNGFAFDSINGTAKVSQGVMRSDDFAMSGPAADVTIKGETNLQAETQHLKVKVLPHVSDSLSLAALAGGPVVGAVAFIAQKILKDPLNKIASSEYEIIGTWDNPQEVGAPKPTPDATKNSPLQNSK